MKVTNSIAIALATAGTSFAAPTQKRAAITDADILNYALTLEHLEDKFYREGLSNFTLADFQKAGYNQTFYNNLKEVSYDETTHVAFLTKALKAANATPVAECTYAFGVTDVKSFIATASILEGVGVSAYLGAAASIVNKDYLTAAGSILTVESRHSSYIRAALAESPFPQAFDTPLDFNEVYTLAAPFIKSCPASNGALPVKAFPMISADASTPATTNATILLNTNGYSLVQQQGQNLPLYAAWIAVTGPVFTPATLKSNTQVQTMVPQGFHGQSFVVLTTRNDTVNDDSVVAGPAIVEISKSNGGN